LKQVPIHDILPSHLPEGIIASVIEQATRSEYAYGWSRSPVVVTEQHLMIAANAVVLVV
jgi:hypothetical protein